MYGSENFIAAVSVGSVISTIKSFIDLLVPVAMTFALLFFIWGLAIFIKDSGNEDARKEGKQKMIWGVIALLVIVSVWAFALIIARTFGVDPNTRAPVPCLPGGNCVGTDGTQASPTYNDNYFGGTNGSANSRTTGGSSGGGGLYSFPQPQPNNPLGR